jgi:hypothetical protein
MKPDELKNIALLKVLKKDKGTQHSAQRLGKTEDWKVLRRFVLRVKQEFLEATLSVDNIEELKRYKNVIYGMESIVRLPEIIEDLKKLQKENKASKKEAEEEAKRRKYNPGVFVRRTVEKLKGGD